MDKIHTGQVQQKPAWYFMLHTIAITLLGLVLFLVSIFWGSFLLLTLREYSIFTRIGIGLTNLLENILFWIFIICGISFGILCYRWLREHTSLYRYRHIYTGIIVVSIVLGIGVAINVVDRETYFLQMGEKSIPGLSHMNKHIRPPRPSVLTEGRVLFIDDTFIIIASKHSNEKIYVQIPSDLVLTTDININNSLIVLGIRDADHIYAQEIIVK